jgi:hypothetical protein
MSSTTQPGRLAVLQLPACSARSDPRAAQRLLAVFQYPTGSDAKFARPFDRNAVPERCKVTSAPSLGTSSALQRYSFSVSLQALALTETGLNRIEPPSHRTNAYHVQ